MPGRGYPDRAKAYVEQREARRTGREPDRWSKIEKEFRSNFDRDIREEIERHERKSKEQQRKATAPVGKQTRRRWWQFYKRDKRTTEGWN